MLKIEAKNPKSPTDELVKPVSGALKQSELDQVTAGNVTLSDFHFIKKMDKSSPQI